MQQQKLNTPTPKNARAHRIIAPPADPPSLADLPAFARTLDEVPSPAFDALFDAQAGAMHGVAQNALEHGRVGKLWHIDPEHGEGTYWYFPIDNMIAVVTYDFAFREPVEFDCETPDLMVVGCYDRHMLPYFGVDDEEGDQTVLGYTWKGKRYVQRVRPNERLTVTSLTLLPAAVHRISARCNVEPGLLSRAICSLDGTKDVLGLTRVFDEIRHARPSPVTARAYYEAKVIETCTLILDWSFTDRSVTPPVRVADRTALNLARRHINDHLDQEITVADLCRITCMSASKLTRLFKQAEGATPQEFVRTCRMERACELLEKGDESMAEVAHAVGFARQGSFSEAFKERFGVSPLKYRRIARGSKA